MASRQEALTTTPPRPVSRSWPVRPVRWCTSSARNSSTPAAQGRNSWSEFKWSFSKRLAQIGRRDFERLAVFGHRAARAVDALFLEHVGDGVVRQRLGRVFGGPELLDE